MKIGVIGCGALGSYYGAKLGHSGQEVHFLLRSDYETVRRKGVLIRSNEGDFRFNPKCAATPEAIGICDLVIIALKSTANDQLAKLLPPLVGPSTAVLTLQNGLGNEEILANLVGAEKVLGGLCFVCINRIEPGVIQHIAHGAIVMGEFNRWPEPRTHDIATHIAHVEAYHRLAREEYGRGVKVWTNATVIQAETEAEARAFYDYYVHEKGDWVAARNVIDTMGAEINQRDYPEARRKAMAEMMISGWGGFPLIGTEEQIVDGLARLSQAGFDGVLTFEWEKLWHPDLAEPEQSFPAFVRVMRERLAGAGA